jgi:hypothetical protein
MRSDGRPGGGPLVDAIHLAAVVMSAGGGDDGLMYRSAATRPAARLCGTIWSWWAWWLGTADGANALPGKGCNMAANILVVDDSGTMHDQTHAGHQRIDIGEVCEAASISALADARPRSAVLTSTCRS